MVTLLVKKIGIVKNVCVHIRMKVIIDKVENRGFDADIVFITAH